MNTHKNECLLIFYLYYLKPVDLPSGLVLPKSPENHLDYLEISNLQGFQGLVFQWKEKKLRFGLYECLYDQFHGRRTWLRIEVWENFFDIETTGRGRPIGLPHFPTMKRTAEPEIAPQKIDAFQ